MPLLRPTNSVKALRALANDKDSYKTSLCSASYVGCQHDTARIVAKRRAAGAVAAERRRLLSNSPPLVDLNILPVCIEVHANW